MKKTYRIEVDCANCANLMEEAANRTEGVQKAVVNFMTQKLIVEFAEGSDVNAVMKNVLNNCKRWKRTARYICNAHNISALLKIKGRCFPKGAAYEQETEKCLSA